MEALQLERKECFGMLNKVFPEGKEGLRQVPQECFQCPEHTECLKAALNTREGISFRMQLLNRTRPNGLVQRIKRWSERKALSRSLKEGKVEPNGR